MSQPEKLGEIERTEKGLQITIPNNDEYSYNSLFDYLSDDLLFWEDMYFETYGNEWLYIEDANHNNVYMVNGYHHDAIKELLETGKATIPVSPDSYEDYQQHKEQE